jgi:hypothetical protein
MWNFYLQCEGLTRSKYVWGTHQNGTTLQNTVTNTICKTNSSLSGAWSTVKEERIPPKNMKFGADPSGLLRIHYAFWVRAEITGTSRVSVGSSQ